MDRGVAQLPLVYRDMVRSWAVCRNGLCAKHLYAACVGVSDCRCGGAHGNGCPKWSE